MEITSKEEFALEKRAAEKIILYFRLVRAYNPALSGAETPFPPLSLEAERQVGHAELAHWRFASPRITTAAPSLTWPGQHCGSDHGAELTNLCMAQGLASRRGCGSYAHLGHLCTAQGPGFEHGLGQVSAGNF